MGDILDLNKKLPVSPEIVIATKMSGELVEILNKYSPQLREDLFAGVVANCLAQIVVKSQNKQANLNKCISYIVHKVEQGE